MCQGLSDFKLKLATGLTGTNRVNQGLIAAICCRKPKMLPAVPMTSETSQLIALTQVDHRETGDKMIDQAPSRIPVARVGVGLEPVVVQQLKHAGVDRPLGYAAPARSKQAAVGQVVEARRLQD